MEHAGIESLKGWIRTTWLPYTQRVPEEERENSLILFQKNISKGIRLIQKV